MISQAHKDEAKLIQKDLKTVGQTSTVKHVDQLGFILTMKELPKPTTLYLIKQKYQDLITEMEGKNGKLKIGFLYRSSIIS